ncbi:AzlC family ABC transporter permease [Carnobacterium funditum]|uniref:AzlC family ABC transporter permease n=1 Tax=Carnobacterium funditum TaxID=2752 RepID=UPI000B0DD521|nr:AzlC family ABC transporter permease [Carnobacterium funditum]
MRRKDWQDGFKIIFLVMLGYIPLGLACGILLFDSGFSIPALVLISLVVFAGAAQFMAASMMVRGATASTFIIMVFFLNLRHLLMSSSLANFLIKVPFLLF